MDKIRGWLFRGRNCKTFVLDELSSKLFPITQCRSNMVFKFTVNKYTTDNPAVILGYQKKGYIIKRLLQKLAHETYYLTELLTSNIVLLMEMFAKTLNAENDMIFIVILDLEITGDRFCFCFM